MTRVSLVSLVTDAAADPSPLIASLHRQTIRDWELIVVDTDDGRASRRRRRSDQGRVRHLTPPGTTAERAATALEEASGELVGFVAPDDELEPSALATATERAGTDVDVVYTDEDRIEADGTRVDPLYKPAWSPDRLRCQHYTGRLTLLRRDLVNEVGGARPEAGDAYEWDLVLRAGERARGIEHVAEVLCHRRARAPGDDGDPDGERRVIEDHLERTGFPATVERGDDPPAWHLRPALRDEPLVSIVIPTAGRARMVHGSPMTLVVNCVDHIVRRSTYENYEIICVVGDEMDGAVRTALRQIAGARLRFVANPGSFNFSQAINAGVLRARGDFLLLLNDDTQVMDADWIEALLMYGQQRDVGAVGAKLLFADGRIQHAGIISPGPGGPGHPCYGFPGNHPGYAGNLVVPANYLAVTGACLLTRRDDFEQVGGFATLFPLNYNDIDYCLKLRHRGRRVVLNPDVRLYHFELSTRMSAKVEEDELEALNERWGTVLARDPFYNPNLLPSTDFLPPIRSMAEARRAPLSA